MKLKRDLEFNSEIFSIFVDEFDYIMHDVEDYEDLTDTEKQIIPREIWNKIMENNGK